MRRTLALAAGASLLVLSACDSSSPAESGSASDDGSSNASSLPEPSMQPEGCETTDELEIGLVTINLQALFFNQINEAAQAMADEYGVDLQIISGENDSVTQANAINTLVADGVDAIIVAAIDTEGIKPAIRAADEAGVPVVAVDAIVEDPAVDTQVGTANAEGGAQIGELLLEESGGEGEVGIVGALNSTIQLERQRGFEEAVTEGGMTIGTVVDGRNIQENAQTAAENLLTGNPDLQYLYATGEPALIGLAAAVRSQAAQDRVTVVGWDLAEPVVDGLEEGWIAGVVQQNTFEFGYQAMAAAIDLACGNPVQEEYPVDTQIVTPENYEDYLYYLEG
ncbi:monosaccharide ABC transporter substrate-binding protein (CUT2 family) [Blastococcus colisei]|uniref:Monosaccharide ABC transporter substrate-binding protein (CUT2 family) n=1 Tax=Blastococcus colisei TaxID=1564162 RepID=A0A543PJE1_9ACTN|nr:substrate-binding domain-containing protein [Blastococcus colisei]TQN44194.1 monosaccharide ABC transporter substrate-binding protein (CUT2 family) [Blastococcus colisei]